MLICVLKMPSYILSSLKVYYSLFAKSKEMASSNANQQTIRSTCSHYLTMVDESV
jgi:hypothetical protein